MRQAKRRLTLINCCLLSKGISDCGYLTFHKFLVGVISILAILKLIQMDKDGTGKSSRDVETIVMESDRENQD